MSPASVSCGLGWRATAATGWPRHGERPVAQRASHDLILPITLLFGKETSSAEAWAIGAAVVVIGSSGMAREQYLACDVSSVKGRRSGSGS
jgi:hypothetical protein